MHWFDERSEIIDDAVIDQKLESDASIMCAEFEPSDTCGYETRVTIVRVLLTMF